MSLWTDDENENTQPDTPQLTFAALREANALRLPQFKNPHGDLAHSVPDGSDWSPAEWLQAVTGELGEYANFRKKFQRGDITLEQFAVHAAKELADVQIYLDILARRCLDKPGCPHPTGVDLGAATREKFNEVSHRVDADVFIDSLGAVFRV
jgi:NTP pyrophosphatase (non-canonical NTP hydrolase)